MTLTEYSQLIQKIESEIPVNEWSYYGMDIWPIIRCSVKPQQFNQKQKIPKKNQYLSLAKRLFFSAYYSMKSLFQPINSVDILFYGASSNYRSMYQSQLIDYYLEPIKLELKSHNKKIASMALYSDDCFKKLPQDLKINDILRYCFALFPINKKALVTPQINDLLKLCLSYDFDFNWNLIYKKIVAEHLYSLLMKRILKNYSPSHLFTVCYSGKWGVIWAAKQLKIKVIDIQHGVQGPLHYEYNFWKYHHNLLPDLFWVWAEKDGEQITNWGGMTFIGGIPYSRAVELGHIELPTNKYTELGITITLQKGFGWSFIKTIINKSNQKIYIRFHPGMTQIERKEVEDFINTIENSDVELIWPNRVSLFKLLLNTSVHITQSSSVAIEAAAQGVPTIVLDKLATKMYSDLIQEKMVFYCELNSIHNKIQELTNLYPHKKLHFYEDIKNLL